MAMINVAYTSYQQNDTVGIARSKSCCRRRCTMMSAYASVVVIGLSSAAVEAGKSVRGGTSSA
jgi:hypothetical protein